MAKKAEQKTKRAWDIAYRKYLDAFETGIEDHPIFGSMNIRPYTKREFTQMFAAQQNVRGWSKASDSSIISALVKEQSSVSRTEAQARAYQKALETRGIYYTIEELMAGIEGLDANKLEEEIRDRYRQLRAAGFKTTDCAKIIGQEFFGSP